MKPRASQGFTIIELMVVIVILFILAALIALTASGVQSRNRNGDRQTDIDTLRAQLETYYAATDTYPTLDNINDPAWRGKNMPRLKDSALNDPRWDTDLACSKNDKTTLSPTPLPDCYSYQVKGTNGGECDNSKTPCAHYTLTATLEGGEKYVKSSLN